MWAAELGRVGRTRGCAGRGMSELRALLLTDVVDSTKLLEQLGDAVTRGLVVFKDGSTQAHPALPRPVLAK